VIHSFDLHIVVALKEVGDFALTEFGIAELSSGGGTAEHKFTTLSRTVRGALVGIDQLLNSIQTIELLVHESNTYVEAVSSPCIFRINFIIEL
jgi:hypothetical protein